MTDENSNIIRLNLKKPKSWNWELSTSKSSPNICFPKIQLFDDRGTLLAETNKPDSIIKSHPGNRSLLEDVLNNNTITQSTSLSHSPSQSSSSLKYEHNRSKSLQNELINQKQQRTTNKTSAKQLSKRSLSSNLLLPTETATLLNGFVSELERNGIDYKIRRRNSNDLRSTPTSQSPSRYDSQNFVIKNIDYEDQPIITPSPPTPPLTLKQRANRGRDQRSLTVPPKQYQRSISSNLEEINRKSSTPIRLQSLVEEQQTRNFIMKKSKSALEIPTTGATKTTAYNANRKNRRAESANTNSMRFSTSILERISEFKRRSSSSSSSASSSGNSQSIGGSGGGDKPKYTLRTSKAGTLVVCEESFRNRRVRRRARSCSKIPGDSNHGDDPTITTATPNDQRLKYKEKIKKEFEYIGGYRNNGGRELKVCTSKTPPKIINVDESRYRKTNPNNRYEMAIANIDELISKISSENKPPSSNSSDIKPLVKSDNNKNVKNNNRRRRHRRSVSAGAERDRSSSSDEEEEKKDRKNNGLEDGNGRIKQRASRTRNNGEYLLI